MDIKGMNIIRKRTETDKWARLARVEYSAVFLTMVFSNVVGYLIERNCQSWGGRYAFIGGSGRQTDATMTDASPGSAVFIGRGSVAEDGTHPQLEGGGGRVMRYYSFLCLPGTDRGGGGVHLRWKRPTQKGSWRK